MSFTSVFVMLLNLSRERMFLTLNVIGPFFTRAGYSTFNVILSFSTFTFFRRHLQLLVFL